MCLHAMASVLTWAAVLTRAVLLVLVLLQLTGCSLLRDRRDAAWDPRGGQLFDQIPNNEGAANTQCGGHLREHERGSRSPRC
jgi:hypothetical protein